MPKFSCIIALLKLTDDVFKVNGADEAIVVFPLDFFRTFDTINRKILVSKLLLQIY